MVTLVDADFGTTKRVRVRGHYTVGKVKSLACTTFGVSRPDQVRALGLPLCSLLCARADAGSRPVLVGRITIFRGSGWRWTASTYLMVDCGT